MTAATRRRLDAKARQAVAFEVLLLVEQGWAVSLAVGKVAHQRGVAVRAVWTMWAALPEIHKARNDVADRRKGRRAVTAEAINDPHSNGRGCRKPIHPSLLTWIEDHWRMGVEPSAERLYARMVGEWSPHGIYLPSQGRFMQLLEAFNAPSNPEKRP